nr:hypothetical protein Iba_chr09eCG2770 [Ipomoea batatas]
MSSEDFYRASGIGAWFLGFPVPCLGWKAEFFVDNEGKVRKSHESDGDFGNGGGTGNSLNSPCGFSGFVVLSCLSKCSSTSLFAALTEKAKRASEQKLGKIIRMAFTAFEAACLALIPCSTVLVALEPPACIFLGTYAGISETSSEAIALLLVETVIMKSRFVDLFIIYHHHPPAQAFEAVEASRRHYRSSIDWLLKVSRGKLFGHRPFSWHDQLLFFHPLVSPGHLLPRRMAQLPGLLTGPDFQL